MSHDPYSNSTPEPKEDRPNYADPRAYETPNRPSGPSNPYGPSDPYTASNPYEPSNPSYSTPPPYGYGAPPPQYAVPQPAYTEGPPPTHPLPLGEAVRALPDQYVRVVTHPGTAVFAEEQGKAAWNIVWVQLLILAVISTLVGLGTLNISLSNALNAGTASASTQQFLQMIKSNPVGFAILFFIFAPIGFFIATGIYHLIAKAFGGRGMYLAYCYCYLLLNVPLSIVNGALSLIPFVGSLLAFAVSIYQIVLLVFMTMAVHRLSGGKATMAVLILPIALIVLSCILAFVIVAAVAGTTPR